MVVYDEHRGTYLGPRVTKKCNTCKVHEHYGYWTSGKRRQFETDCLENDFLSSSEDTAVGLDHSILHPHSPPPPAIEVSGNPRGRGDLKRPFLEGYLCRHPELVSAL